MIPLRLLLTLATYTLGTEAINQSLPQCQDAILKHCKANGSHGYSCSNDPTQCIPTESWCNGGTGNRWPQAVCENFENFHLTNCFSWNFKLIVGGRMMEYLFVWASVDWDLAEMYCQSEGYHLLSLQSQNEMKKIRNRLHSFRLYETGVDRRSKVFDPMGVRCQGLRWNLTVWLGIFYNHRRKQWEQTDGKSISGKLNAKVKPETNPYYYKDNLEEYLRSPDETCSQPCTETAIQWLIIGTFSSHKKPRFRSFSQPESRSSGLANAILCKRDPKQTEPYFWSGVMPGRQVCTSGFMCRRSYTCIVGYWFADSMLCDGNRDCPDGEDELLTSCPHINASTADATRKYLFFPMARKYSQARSFCEQYGFHLPSLHSSEDERLLLALPAMFGRMFPTLDFRTQQRDWAYRDWYVTLGRNYSLTQWDDGSSVNYTSDFEELNPFPVDAYLVLESGSPRPLSAYFVDDRQFVSHVFCQETLIDMQCSSSTGASMILVSLLTVLEYCYLNSARH